MDKTVVKINETRTRILYISLLLSYALVLSKLIRKELTTAEEIIEDTGYIEEEVELIGSVEFIYIIMNDYVMNYYI